jgi:hypothetical protein
MKRVSPNPIGVSVSASSSRATRCGHEILHLEGDRADRAQPVQLRRDPPAAPGGRAGQIERVHQAARVRRAVKAMARLLQPVGLINHQRAGAILNCNARRAADQRAGLNGLAGPVNAAIEIDIGFRHARRAAAGDRLIAQIHRRAVQVQHREIALRAIAGDQARRVAFGPAISGASKVTRPSRAVRLVARTSLARETS